MIDLRLNAIIDAERANGRSLADLTRMVVAGGATLIQLRDKYGSTRRMIEEARSIKAVLAGTGVPLVINDRVDVALAAGADGVHVGQDDMPAEEARRLLGPKAIIGLSVKSVALANAALDALVLRFEVRSNWLYLLACSKYGSMMTSGDPWAGLGMAPGGKQLNAAW